MSFLKLAMSGNSSSSKVLGKRRGRSWDDEVKMIVEQEAMFYSRFTPVTVLMSNKLYDTLHFMRNKCIEGSRVRAVVPCIRAVKLGQRGPSHLKHSVFDFDLHLENDTMVKDVVDTWVEDDPLSLIIDHLPLCIAFLLGMLPKMGRNESTWVEVDEDTRKRVRSPPDSHVHRAFVQHTLGERQLVREIFSFLC